MSEFENGNLTPWGYIADSASIPDFLTAAEFANYTAGKFGNDVRIATNIPSAVASIRNHCGWHISPSLTCGMVYRIADLRDAFVGNDLLVQLPATFVTGVSRVVLDATYDTDTDAYVGEDVTDFDFGMGTGLLRIYDVGIRDRKSQIFIKYTAGYADGDIPVLKELAADMVTHAVANPYGVNSEAAGGVSVSYSSTWASQTGSTALANNTREVLDVYKVKGVF